MNLKILSRKSILIILIQFFISAFSSAEDNWVLAASKFEFPQEIVRTKAENSFAQLLPSLILEQISEGLVRYSPENEILDRKYVSLLNERQSLLLTLSKEIKTRDAIVISHDSQRKINKLIQEQEKKIETVKKQIDENLEASRILSEEHIFIGEKKKGFNFFDFISGQEESGEDITGKNETLALYKNSSSSLFTQNEKLTLERSVLAEKINGLITGEIRTYGNYASVTVYLNVFPGQNEQAVITEVGAMDRPLEIARNIALRLVPAITNNLPVELYFEITPAELEDKCTVIIDGVIHSSKEKNFIIHAGRHEFSFESEGYITKSLVYIFNGNQKYLITVPMQVNELKEMKITLLNPVSGSLYADGKLLSPVTAEMPSASVTVNGRPVIGRFITPDNKGFFYYIPENLQQDNNSLTLKTKVYDTAELIDQRRIWTYRAYTAVVLSIPFTLFASGRVNSLSYAYSNGSAIDVNEINRWQNIKYISMGVTGACAGFFAYEVVRYLITANSVLPQNVKVVQSEPIDETYSEQADSTEEELQSDNLYENKKE